MEKKIKCEIYNDSMQNWKAVAGYEGLYEVSTNGAVRSITHYTRNNPNGGERLSEGRMLVAYKMPNGYRQVQLSKNEKREKKYVHRLVAETFLDNPDNLSDVNHKNGDKDNNAVCNLEWVSHKDNQRHMVKNGLTKKAYSVICVETGMQYNSMSEAESDTGINRKVIQRSCNHLNTRCNYHFEWGNGNAKM